MDNNNTVIKHLFKGFFSFLALLGILFYLYVRFLVKKLPQNLPSINIQIFLYFYICG